MNKAAALGEILTHKAIEILHSSLFPGMIGCAEVALRLELLADFPMPGELQAVIVG